MNNKMNKKIANRKSGAGFALSPSKGFTLLELLIVIGILAILAAIIIIVLNPAEFLKRSRDVKRQTDLQSLNSAIVMSMGIDPGIDLGAPSTVYVSLADSTTTCANLGLPVLPAGWQYHCAPDTTLQKIDGSGWMPVNFASLPTGSPISNLPIDPVNASSSGLYYTYNTGGSWKLTAVFESAQFLALAQGDGGLDDDIFEAGSAIALGPSLSRGDTPAPGATPTPFLPSDMAGLKLWLRSDLGVTYFDTAGIVTGVLVYSGGSGYQVEDVVTVINGDNNCTLRVLEIYGGGGVSSIEIVNSGSGYTSGDAYNTTGGHGSGFKVNVTASVLGGVSSWTDQSGNNNDATVGENALGPIRISSDEDFSGHNSLLFVPQDIRLTFLGLPASITIDDCTLFAVFNTIGTRFFHSSDFEIGVSEDPYLFWADTDMGITVYSSIIDSPSNTVLGVWKSTAGSKEISFYANGVDKTTGSWDGFEKTPAFWFMGFVQANMRIAEILLYNTPLSDSNRQLVENYLNSRYAIY